MTTNATDTHIATIRARAYNETAREMARTGVYITHEQADEIGDVGMDWLRTRLGLEIETDDRGVVAAAVQRCECGEWSGERCEGTLGEDAATVEYMPDHLRASHTAAGNRGSHPANGSVRIRVTPECAAIMVDTDGEWCSVVAARPRKS